MSQPTSPGALDRAKRAQVHEMEDTFVRQMKELKFKLALRTAHNILALDPSNTRVQEFVPLLEEKVAMDEEDEESDQSGDDTSQGAGEGEAGEGGSQDQDGSSDDDTDSDSDEESTSEDEGEDSGAEVERRAGDAGPRQAEDTIPAHPVARRRWLHDTTTVGVGVDGGVGETYDSAASASHVSQLVLDNSNSQLTSAQRRRIREDLARSIAGLKAQEAAQKIIDSDPLLNA